MVSERLGAKRVITVAMVISAAATLLTPTAIRFNVYLTVALRVLLGIVAGVLIPALMSMWARWAPAAERAKLVAIGASGTNLGTIVANLVSGYLCGIPVDEGWPFIFYTFGAVTLVWVILWHYLTHDTPNEHPRISDAERDLLEQMNSRTNQTGAKKKIPPLRSIFTSAPFVAMMTTQLCDTWSMCLNVTYLPLYLSEILHFDTATSGVLASLPWVSAFLGTWAFAALADYLHVGHVMSVTKSRKLFQTIGQLGPASILLGYGFISPELRSLAVALMVVLTGLQSACRSGYILNRLDLAPRYAGSLTGLTTTIANIAQIVNPLVTSAIISDHRQESWREIFMITAFLSISGTVIYLIFGSAEEQEWAKDGSLDQTVIYTPSDASLRRSRDQNDSYVTDTRRGGCGHGAK
ncbi:hypothetical protein BaRGS_00022713 [Batillaria attramentaria]|uniref:Major facilitator superfamily (MFS) profile domain-containing protein n=1 Tax=Batillaria attramentaria TaxID=370345 RepID=A0ABD0KGC8_9CAEN